MIWDYRTSISCLEFVWIVVVHLVKLAVNVTIKLKCVGKLKIIDFYHRILTLSIVKSSDGKTYRNYCHLMESSKLAKAEQKPIIKVFKRKPCDSGTLFKNLPTIGF